MINQLSASLLLPGELAKTISDYLKVLQNASIEETFLTGLIGLLEGDIARLNSAITAIRINKLVDEVAAADAQQDDLFIGFKDMVDAQKRRDKPAIQEAYGVIWPILERAGLKLYNLGYVEQSGKMTALFEQLDTAASQTALTTLKLTEFYVELKDAHAHFKGLYEERLKLDSVKDYPTLSDAKNKAVPHVNSLLDALDVLAELENEAVLSIANEINTITDQINATARARKTRGSSATGEVDSTLV